MNMYKLLLLFSISISLAGCMDSMHSSSTVKTHFDSEGERIYFTGRSEEGELIQAVGGHHHVKMHGGSCVTCHGAEREGGAIMWPRFWVSAPPLTYGALVQTHDDGHQHNSYDASSLKLAILKGINPEGNPLHDTMPRWEMSEKDLNALVDYLLKSAGPHTH
jgi:cytochrome c oxidase subunit II